MRMGLIAGSWCKGLLQAGPLWSSEPSRIARRTDGRTTAIVRSRRCSPQQVHSEGLHVFDHAQAGAVAGVSLAQARLSRRRVYPFCYLVWPHAQNGLVVARARRTGRSNFIVSALTSR